jgi:flagellar secretion chaperone FliS
MFASATGYSVSRRQAGTYKQVSTETGIFGASAHGLIGMLFDGLTGAIAEARGAMRSRNIPVKCDAISRALRIVDEGLSSSLNLEDGGPLASDLRSLYSYIAVRLAQANLNNDEAALDECGKLIETLRDAWSQIGDRVPA